QNIAHQIGYVRIARCFRVKVDNEGRDNSWLIFATMRGESDLKRLEQGRRLTGAFQDLMNFLLMPIGHCRNDRVFVLEIAINQTDTDPSLGANVVHAGLVKASLGEANQRGIENLGASIEARFY